MAGENLNFGLIIDAKVMGKEQIDQLAASIQAAAASLGTPTRSLEVFVSAVNSAAVGAKNASEIFKNLQGMMSGVGGAFVRQQEGVDALTKAFMQLAGAEQAAAEQEKRRLMAAPGLGRMHAQAVEEVEKVSRRLMAAPSIGRMHAQAVEQEERISRRLMSAPGLGRMHMTGGDQPKQPKGPTDTGYWSKRLLGSGAFFLGQELGSFNIGFLGADIIQMLTGTTAKVVGGGIAAAAGGLMAVRQVEETAKYAQQQANLAQEVGMSPQEVQLFGRVAEVTGVQVNALFSNVNKLNDSMAKGGAEARTVQRSLAALGLDTVVAFEAPEKQITSILGALGKITDQSERTRLVVNLFGESGRKLLPLVDSFNEVSAAIKRTGVILDQEGVDKLVRHRMEVEKLKMSWEGIWHTVSTFGAGYLNFVIAAFTPRRGGPNFGSPDDYTGGMYGPSITSPGSTTTINTGGGFFGPASPELDAMRATTKQDRAKRVEAARRAGLDRIGVIQREIQINKEEMAQAERDQDPDLMRQLAGKGVGLERQLREEERKRNIARGLQEQLAQYEKRSDVSAFEKIMSGIGPVGQYRAQLHKVEAEEKDKLRRIEDAGDYLTPLERAQYRGRAIIAAVIERQAVEEKERTRVKVEAEQLELAGQRADIGIEASIRQAGMYDEKRAVMLNRYGPTAIPLLPGGGLGAYIPGGIPLPYDLPLGPGISAGGEAQAIRFFQRRGEKQIQAASMMGDLGGFQTAQAHYNLRLQVAVKEFDLAERKAKLLEEESKGMVNSEKYQEAQQLRQRASAELENERDLARIQRDQEAVRVYANQMQQFGHAFSSIFMAAQHGRGVGGAIRGFVEGQESRLLENVGGHLFSRGIGGVFHRAGASLPPWLTKGTLFESPAASGPEAFKLYVNEFGAIVKEFGTYVGQGKATSVLKTGDEVATPPPVAEQWFDPRILNIATNPDLPLWTPSGGIGKFDSAWADYFGEQAANAPMYGPWFGAGGTNVAPGGGGAISGGGRVGGGGSFFSKYLNVSGQQRWDAIMHGVDPTDPMMDPGNLGALQRLGYAAPFIGSLAGGAAAVLHAQGTEAKLRSAGMSVLSAAPMAGPAAPFVAAAGGGLMLASAFKSDNPERRKGAKYLAAGAALPPLAVVGAYHMIKSFFSKSREDEMRDAILKGQYLAPQAQHLEEGFGGYSDTDAFGNIRTSNLSPYQVTSNSYLDYPRRTVVPGRTTGQFGGPTGAPSAMNLPNPLAGATININAIDHATFSDYMTKNASAVGDGVRAAVQGGHPELMSALGQALGTR